MKALDDMLKDKGQFRDRRGRGTSATKIREQRSTGRATPRGDRGTRGR